MRKLFLTVALMAAGSSIPGYADETANDGLHADEVIVRVSQEQLNEGMATMFYDSVDTVAQASLFTKNATGASVLTGSFKLNVRLSQAGALFYLEEKTDDWVLHLYNVRGHRLSDLLGEYYGVRVGGGLFFNARLQTLANRNFIVGVSGHRPEAGDFLVGASTGVMWVSIEKPKDSLGPVVDWNTVIQ